MNIVGGFSFTAEFFGRGAEKGNTQATAKS